MSRELYMFIMLMGTYGFLQAKLVDCHLSNPAEEMMRERELKDLQNEKDLYTYHDENSSEEEKLKALENLIKNEGML